MQPSSFEEAVADIIRDDPRYRLDAYLFVKDALDATVNMLEKPNDGPGRHVSGQELLEGIREYALQEYGPMCRTVLATWGIHRSEDIGEIVFNLVDHDILRKTGDDKREDFAAGYDFHEAFVRPFRPAVSRMRTGSGRKTKTKTKTKTDDGGTRNEAV